MKQRSHRFAASLSLIGCLAASCLNAQSPSTNHPVQPHLPTTVRAPASGAASEPVALPPFGQQTSPPIRHIAPAPPVDNSPSAVDAYLAWDAINKTVTVTNGTPEAHFTFYLTNVSPSEIIVISNATASCGCTVAQLPKIPWPITPGEHGDINVTMNLAGKYGAVTKEITLFTDQGTKKLSVTSDIRTASLPQISDMDRANNQKIALADRQAVFKGDCAKCHVEPVQGKWGKELYDTACGICHEGEHRATMVPNLHTLPQPTNADFWRNSITHGKTNSLMPAFAVSEGGILSDLQVNALVSYLQVTIPSRPVPVSQSTKPPGG